MILFCLLLLGNARATDWGVQGEFSLKWHQFAEDEKVETEDAGMTVFSRAELRHEGSSHRHVLRVRGTSDTKKQSSLAVEDAYLSRAFADQRWHFLAGFKTFHWSVMEAFHPADVINSRHYSSDPENLDKLGEATLELEKYFDRAALSLSFFPRFEHPRFPPKDSRFGTGVDLGDPVRPEKSSPQAALRWTTTREGMDLGVHAIHHIDRHFPIVAANGRDLAPHYFEATQFGLTVTKAWGSSLFKAEAVTRNFDDGAKPIFSVREMAARRPLDHHELAFGIEHTLDLSLQSETTLMAELGGIFGVDREARKEMAIFQRDLFLGIRHALNDSMGRELFAGLITDIERKRERIYTLKYDQRLSDVFKVNTGVRIYDAPVKGNVPYGPEGLDGDNHIYFNLVRFF